MSARALGWREPHADAAVRRFMDRGVASESAGMPSSVGDGDGAAEPAELIAGSAVP